MHGRSFVIGAIAGAGLFGTCASVVSVVRTEGAAPEFRPLPLSQALSEFPNRSPIPGAGQGWKHADDYTQVAYIPLRVAREMLGDEGWARCLDVLEDGGVRGVCGSGAFDP